jgi:hypothetical protein
MSGRASALGAVSKPVPIKAATASAIRKVIDLSPVNRPPLPRRLKFEGVRKS